MSPTPKVHSVYVFVRGATPSVNPSIATLASILQLDQIILQHCHRTQGLRGGDMLGVVSNEESLFCQDTDDAFFTLLANDLFTLSLDGDILLAGNQDPIREHRARIRESLDHPLDFVWFDIETMRRRPHAVTCLAEYSSSIDFPSAN